MWLRTFHFWLVLVIVAHVDASPGPPEVDRDLPRNQCPRTEHVEGEISGASVKISANGQVGVLKLPQYSPGSAPVRFIAEFHGTCTYLFTTPKVMLIKVHQDIRGVVSAQELEIFSLRYSAQSGEPLVRYWLEEESTEPTRIYHFVPIKARRVEPIESTTPWNSDYVGQYRNHFVGSELIEPNECELMVVLLQRAIGIEVARHALETGWKVLDISRSNILLLDPHLPVRELPFQLTFASYHDAVRADLTEVDKEADIPTQEIQKIAQRAELYAIAIEAKEKAAMEFPMDVLCPVSMWGSTPNMWWLE